MRYLISIISITFLLSEEIKTTTEKYLLDQFPNNISFKMHSIELDNKIIKLVQNKAKQKFYRDKLYYWNISQDDLTIAYALLDNVAFKMDYGTKTIKSDTDNPTTQINLGIGYNF